MIKQILEGDKTRYRKQRHTGTKIFEVLKDAGYTGGYTTLTDYLRKEHRKQREAFLPLEFELGTYAEVDWTNAYIYLKGKETKAHIFIMKLRGSGCRPGRGNEKGGAENAGKEAVRKFFVPYPDVSSFEELNEYLHLECVKMLEQNSKWEAEKAALRPLPKVRFNGARYKEAKVNRYSMVQLETNRYSVPTSYVGEKVTLKVTADKVVVLSKNNIIAEHPRLYGRNQDHILLDHYLELLLQKSRTLGNTKVYKPQTLPSFYEE